MVSSIINEIKRCKTARGHYTIGIFDINEENYSALKKVMPIMREIEKISSIFINGKLYSIKFINGGDLKFLLSIYGKKFIHLFRLYSVKNIQDIFIF